MRYKDKTLLIEALEDDRMFTLDDYKGNDIKVYNEYIGEHPGVKVCVGAIEFDIEKADELTMEEIIDKVEELVD